MTVIELHKILSQAISDGYSDIPVAFDAEARNFHCHYVGIDMAGVSALEDNGVEAIFTMETHYHQDVTDAATGNIVSSENAK